ncbi:hypothetical protein T440DRAFT_518050 [Plenodomus tracheiphilus IPT5]|uniref:Uncharacterized protein n=1 Tax=Plenodomus tracheiphilus IPT5 TaxID=1408161 RepID=A0A6A7B5I4_9PLEO|nr:hypothetical protein T440DRAFT_518050 [Plenodomus tracheiphilus IPT5]
MAPHRTVPEAPPTAHAVAGTRVAKAKRKDTVRRFENGLLNFEHIRITQENAKQSPLLRLPAELRNQIWELVLGGNICYVDRKPWSMHNRKRQSFRVTNVHSALLRICRQVYSETALLPFQLNEFCFYLDASIWFSGLHKYGQDNIRIIRVKIDDPYSPHSNEQLREMIQYISQGLKEVLIETSSNHGTQEECIGEGPSAFRQGHWLSDRESKARSKPVRRFRNGILDVERKCGKYAKITKQNAQVSLLRLPPELRNQIWQLALGGHVFNARYVNKTIEVTGRKESGTSPLPQGGGAYNLALLRTCRQIYAEAVLYPYQCNIFDVSTIQFTRIIRSFPNVGRKYMRNIQFSAYRIRFRLDSASPGHKIDRPPAAFSSALFPSLRRVVINNIMGPQFFDKAAQKLREKYTKKRKDLEVIIKRVGA